MKSQTRVVRRTRVTCHQHSRYGKERHNRRAGRSKSADGRQEVQSWIGHEPAELFQIIRKTVQRKNPIIQRSVSGDRADHDSPDSVCRETRSNEFNRAINEENIDFNIPGVPHSAVKRSHGVNVRNLIQKIENHPQRHALQSDLQQHRQFNPFSKESQDVIKVAGNTELCELLDVEPKAQCKVCLSYWDVGIVYCTCGHFFRDDTN